MNNRCEVCEKGNVTLDVIFPDTVRFSVCDVCCSDLARAATVLGFDVTITAPRTTGTQLTLVQA